MRWFFAVALLIPLVAGCTPYIPVKDDFGTSALRPTGRVPPEFAEFNNYDPRAGNLVATQLCATGYEPIEQREIGAAPGGMIAQRGRCAPYIVSATP